MLGHERVSGSDDPVLVSKIRTGAHAYDVTGAENIFLIFHTALCQSSFAWQNVQPNTEAKTK